MTWSPMEVEEKMESVIELLESAIATYKAIGEKAAVAENRAKLEEAKALLQTIGSPELKTESLKKAWVMTQVSDLMLKSEIAKHHAAAGRETIRGLTTEADLLRTMAASHRQMTSSSDWGSR